MKITRIRITPVRTPGPATAPYVIHSINPIYRYPDLKYDAPPESRPIQPDGPGSLVVEIETDEGVTGVTQKGYGPSRRVYRHRKSPRAPCWSARTPMRTDWLWEKMHRYCISQAREGIASQRHQRRRHGPLGPQGALSEPAGLQPARREDERPPARVRKPAVRVRERAGRPRPGPAAGRGVDVRRSGLYGGEATVRLQPGRRGWKA